MDSDAGGTARTVSNELAGSDPNVPDRSIQRELARLTSERLETIRAKLLRGRRPLAEIAQLRDDLKAVFSHADSRILYALTRHRYDEEVAEFVVGEILRHMATLEQKLGRAVSIKVAALDYFEAVEGLCDQLELIEESQLTSLAAAAMHDTLTGCYARAVFDYRLPEEFDRALRYGKPLSLVMFDLDRFKAYNDAFGHVAGDRALAAVGRIARATVRTADLLFRYGGEELALLLPETAHREAKVLAERLVIDVAQGATIAEGFARPLTISAGLASLAVTDRDPKSLLARADAWLYRAKASGRNQLATDSAS